MEKHPVIVGHLGSILIDEYHVPAKQAFKEASRLLDLLAAHDLQIIKGEWLVPEERKVYVKVTPQDQDPWMTLASKITKETMEREPWKAKEIQ